MTATVLRPNDAPGAGAALPPATTARHGGWRSGWLALVLTSLARALLTLIASMLLWSVLPVALGWHTTVVMSGSMEPRLHPGDVVVSRPIATDRLRPGQVVLVDDPDHAGRLRLHRLAALRPDGKLTLRGDANAADDSTPVARSAVHGVASLHIPYLGLLKYWQSVGDDRDVVLGLAALLAVLAAAFVFRPDTAEAVPPTAVEERIEPDPAPATVSPRPARHAVLAGRLGVTCVLVVALVVGTLGTAGPARAASTFGATTANTGDHWTAATYFSCTNAATADGARFAWPLSESSGSTAADVTGNGLTGTYSSSGVTYGVAGPCNGKTGVALNGSAGTVSQSTSVSSVTNISFETWFKASSSTHGGTLESLTNSSSSTSMALAMTTTGTLTLAVSASSSTKTVSTTATFNDNSWHLAVGVVGASGMALYVDTRAAVTNSAATSAASASGTVRVGYGNHSSLGTGSYDYFQGSVAYAAFYKVSLTATQVANHYAAT